MKISVSLVGSLGALALASCGPVTINLKDPQVNITSNANLSSVQPSEQVPVTASAQNVYLCDPSVMPPPADASTAGYFQVYFDDFNGQPILITAQTTFTVTIPANASAGPHKVLCRIHKHDGTPTTAVTELDITVTVSVVVGG